MELLNDLFSFDGSELENNVSLCGRVEGGLVENKRKSQ